MKKSEPLTAVIWDWNGTLLNDVKVSLLSVNQELAARNLSPVTENYYRSHFDFPVKDFYEKIGINFSRENFDEMSHRFLETYFRNLNLASLHEGATDTLQLLNDHGIPQYVLSAMEQQRLEKMLKDYGIDHYFRKIRGPADVYADGKMAAGHDLIKTEQIEVSSCWMVGDTLHDLEVARTLGLNCILLACGHQTKQRLQKDHDLVLNDFRELKSFFLQMI